MAAGVYTIWRHADGSPVTTVPGPVQLVYVGYSGRELKKGAVDTKLQAAVGKNALWSRLQAHASGQRGSDQFSLYVGDRFVLPTLSAEDIAAVAAGRVRMNALVRRYVIEHLAFRWVETADAATAREIEAAIRRGDWEHGKPFLNPIRAARPR